MLKLKDWPSPSACEEFFSYQRPEFISQLPLVEFIHSKWGLLNVAAKMPHYSLQNDVGPKIFLSYGMLEELGRGDSVSNLHLNMRDMVYILVHTSETKLDVGKRTTLDEDKKASDKSETKDSSMDPPKGLGKTDSPSSLLDGHDHRDEFTVNLNMQFDATQNQQHIQSGSVQAENRNLGHETGGVQPWSFQQYLGEAVFIPAGCPFQARNLQSTVQLGLDFLSPESLGEAVKLAEDVGCLPNDYSAKLQMMEVGKISLYAASSAIYEAQKLVLDPKLGADLHFDDPNLTKAVSENLENMIKQQQITCV